MIKKIFMIHHTHYDIGFTDLPDEVVRQQLTYLDEAVELGEKDPAYCWTLESGSLLRNYLEYRPARQAERLLRLLQTRQFEVAAFDMQTLTETLSFPELFANVNRIAALGKKYNFPVECAILDDIGGWTTELPSVMNVAGIRYLIAGCGAFQTELPWAELPHLFYLTDKSGGRILVWNLGNDRQAVSCESLYPFPVYGMASIFMGYRAFPEFFGEYDLGVKMPMHGDTEEHKLTAKEVYNILENRLEREKYPYEEVLFQYGGDNRNPAPRLSELVKKYNSSGDYPEIKLGVPSEFFHLMEEKYSSVIPEISGTLADPWNLRINAVPSVLKSYRAAQRNYSAALMRNLKDENILENLMLTGDHTLGLNTWGWQLLAEKHGGLTAPCFDRYRDSWKQKAYYAENAFRMSEKLLDKCAVSAEFADSSAVVVRNYAPHKVSGSVEVYFGSYAKKLLSLTDADGREIPRQLTGQNRWMLLVKDVPALGSLRLNTVFDKVYDDIPAEMDMPVPEKITTPFYSVELACNGTVKVIKSSCGKIVMSGDCGGVCAETLHNTLSDGGACGLKPELDRVCEELADVSGKITADGELFTEITVSGTFASGNVRRIMRVWKDINRIDFSFRLDLPEHAEKICYYAKFPFAGNDGKFRFDQNLGITSPEELLPGSMLDLFYCSRFASVESDGFSAVLCTVDAPIVEFDGMHTAKWRKELPLKLENNQIYGLLYNNVCNTDAPSWQRVLERFDYSLFAGEGSFAFDSAQRNWNSVTALSAQVSFEKADHGITAFPDTLRIHPDGEGGIFVENPNNFSVEFNGRTIAPFALMRW